MQPSLEERVRGGLWLLLTLAGVLVFFNLLTLVGRLSHVLPLTLFRLASTAACLLFLVAKPRKERVAVRTGLAGALLFVVSSSALAWEDDHYVSIALLGVAITTTAAGYVPWGVPPQLLLVLTSLGCTLGTAYAVEGTVGGGLSRFDMAAITASYAVSLYLAQQLARSRVLVARRLHEASRSDERVHAYHSLVDTIQRAELRFIAEGESEEIFEELLASLLELTDSSYGLICEVVVETGEPFLACRSVRETSWDEETRRRNTPPRIPLSGNGNLLASIVEDGASVMMNEPLDDGLRASLPFPPRELETFLALPFGIGDELVGIVAIGNRQSGYDPELVEYLRPFLTNCAHLTKANRNESRRRHAEEEVRQLNSELERRVHERTAELEVANRELQRFSYTLSHDLRSPLRAINGFSKFLLDEHAEHLDDHGRDCLDRVRAAALHMGALIDDVLTLARVSSREILREQVDLSDISRQVAEELQRESPERSVDFVIGDGILVVGDRALLRVALTNMLGNAWKFTNTRERARIEFNMVENDGKRTYFVADDGVGFDMTFSSKLFKPFERLHAPDEFEGTGIGLAIVQRIVGRHGGRVWAKGDVENGATFFFTLGVK